MIDVKQFVAALFLIVWNAIGCISLNDDPKREDAWTILAKQEIEEINSGSRDSLSLMYTRETDKLLTLIDPDAQFHHAYFLLTDISKSGIAEMASGRGVRSLNLVCTTNPEGILEAIAEIDSLRKLSFESIPLTKSGIEALQKRSLIEELKFSSDETERLPFDLVSSLKKIATLRKLVINETEVALDPKDSTIEPSDDARPER
jgi:hypothetical protein